MSLGRFGYATWLSENGMIIFVLITFFPFNKNIFTLFQREREIETVMMRGNHRLAAFCMPYTGIKPTTWAYKLAGNQTMTSLFIGRYSTTEQHQWASRTTLKYWIMWEWTSFVTTYTNNKGFLIFKTLGYNIVIPSLSPTPPRDRCSSTYHRSIFLFCPLWTGPPAFSLIIEGTSLPTLSQEHVTGLFPLVTGLFPLTWGRTQEKFAYSQNTRKLQRLPGLGLPPCKIPSCRDPWMCPGHTRINWFSHLL